MPDLDRRNLIKLGALTGAAALPGIQQTLAATQLQVTPPETEGPFYPVREQKDKDFDLTVIQGSDKKAKGEVILVEGKVVDVEGNPIEDVTVDLWQANAAGRYAHPRDTNKAPLDPDFQGWAIVPSGKEGGFTFKTILPGAYPVSRKWHRPPHIHFKFFGKGVRGLTTQMYFPGDALNKKDRLILSKTEAEQALMISKLEGTRDGIKTFSYKVILAGA